eukprot:9606_1
MKIDKRDSNHINDNCCGKFQQKIKNAKDSISNILRDNKDKSLPVYSNVSPSDNILDTFNQFEWYVAYDEAVLAIASETIGPRLADSDKIFEIQNNNQLKLEEWYAKQYNVKAEYESIKLEITKKKQIIAMPPQKKIQSELKTSLQILREAQSHQNSTLTDNSIDMNDGFVVVDTEFFESP